MKVLLINPPIAFPKTVYSSVPILLGQLKHNNIDSTSVDFNIEFLKTILSRKYLTSTKKLLQKIYRHEKYINQNTDEKYKLSKEQIKELKSLISNFLSQHKKELDFVIKNADKLLDTYYNLLSFAHSDEDKKEAQKYERYITIALVFAYLPFYPARLYVELKSPKAMLYEYNPLYINSFEDIINYCSDRKRNIYIKILEDKIKKFKLKKYDVVGITVPYNTNVFIALTLAKIIKEKTKAKVILGGPAINLCCDNLTKFPQIFNTFFDGLILGEGEKAIIEYIKYVENKLQPNEVSGLVYKENNEIRKNGIAQIADMNEVYVQSFDGIDFKNYAPAKVIRIEFSKGCYWGRCIFCYSNCKKIKYKTMSPIKAVDMIEELMKKYNIKFFHILDSALSVSFAENFAKEIISRNLEITYIANFRFEDNLSSEIIENLRKSGLINIFFGLESASQRILTLMNKGINLNTAKRILKDCHTAGMETVVSIITGFPTETEEDIRKTAEFIKENKENIHTLLRSTFLLEKGSAILEKEISEKLNIKDITEKKEISAVLSYSAPTISEERIIKILSEYGI